jgi:hypothetical protein
MDFENHIRELCQEILTCQTEEEAVDLTRRMQELLHRRIEDLRSNVSTAPLFPSETFTEPNI